MDVHRQVFIPLKIINKEEIMNRGAGRPALERGEKMGWCAIVLVLIMKFSK